MKPLILKTHEGLYICEIPIENEPEDGATDTEWWILAATGVGSSPIDAYNDWVKDWEYCIMPDEDSVDWDEFQRWMESGNA